MQNSLRLQITEILCHPVITMLSMSITTLKRFLQYRTASVWIIQCYKASLIPHWLINPLFAIAGFLGGGEKKVPSTLYQDGKYYQFESKKKATMAYYNQLDDPNIDPAAGWNMVRVKLALPEALVTFAPNDVFNSFTGFKAPRFIESGKKTFGKKEFNYDKYSTTYNNMNGQPMYKKNFYMLYDLEKGELQSIKVMVRVGNEEEREADEIKNIKITGELPEKITDIPEGCKVYAVGLGDINDLVQRPVLVENYSKKETEAK